MSQKVKTPDILPCAICGAKATALDWDYRDMWRVMCGNNHTATKECGTKHRAICKWNSAQIATTKNEAQIVHIKNFN